MGRNWLQAAAACDLGEGKRLVKRLGGRQILLIRTAAGIFAVDNRCPHEGYPLAQGTVDVAGCILTCNWHNWKFKLSTGECPDGDHVRSYPVEIRGEDLWIGIDVPDPAAALAKALPAFETAFRKRQYGRLSREMARLIAAGGDETALIEKGIQLSHGRLENGFGHAYAAAADWLWLREKHRNEPDLRLACSAETVDMMSEEHFGEEEHPYAAASSRPFDPAAFLAAVEDEDEAGAIAFIHGALDAGKRWQDLEGILVQAALGHYLDFGHSAIYTHKAGELIGRLGPGVETPVVLSLVRSIVRAWREDLIPQFRGYGDALKRLSGRRPPPATERGAEPSAADLRGRNVADCLEWVERRWGRAAPLDLYHALLEAAAWNLLHYDARLDQAYDKPVSRNVSWLGFTHAVTFANAVRTLCGRHPDLWPQGLLQLACFVGRNSAHVDPSIDASRWKVTDPAAFFSVLWERLPNHEMGLGIFSAHYVKTSVAVWQECQQEGPALTRELCLAGLNRFLHSPIRQKHPRRTARQALQLTGP